MRKGREEKRRKKKKEANKGSKEGVTTSQDRGMPSRPEKNGRVLLALPVASCRTSDKIPSFGGPTIKGDIICNIHYLNESRSRLTEPLCA